MGQKIWTQASKTQKGCKFFLDVKKASKTQKRMQVFVECGKQAKHKKECKFFVDVKKQAKHKERCKFFVECGKTKHKKGLQVFVFVDFLDVKKQAKHNKWCIHKKGAFTKRGQSPSQLIRRWTVTFNPYGGKDWCWVADLTKYERLAGLVAWSISCTRY